MRDDGSGKLVNIFLKVKIDDVCIYTVSPWGRTSRVRSMNPSNFVSSARIRVFAKAVLRLSNYGNFF